MWVSDFVGVAELDPDFNIAVKDNQLYLQKFCKDLAALDFIVEASSKCWYEDFIRFLTEDQGEEFPVKDLNKYYDLLLQWSKTKLG